MVYRAIPRFTSFLIIVLGSYASASRSQAFSVSVNIPTQTIHPGDTNVAVPVTLSGDGTYSGPVTVTMTGLPSGITVTPLTLTPGTSGTLLMNASLAADQEAFPATSPQNSDTAWSFATVIAVAGTQQSTATFILLVSLENPSFAPQPSNINLPIVQINTNDVPIVDTTTEISGTITITSADGQTSFLPGASGSDDTATFHIHGNSTSLMPKKPYHVKLNTSADLLGGMGLQCGYVTSSGKPVCDKSKSYILLANYDDKTLLRDWSASALANAIPVGGQYLNEAADSPSPSGTSALMPWASHSLFVELYLNGQYEGNYQLIEEVKVDSHRVNVTEMTDTDISGTALTGGYLMEIDQRQDEDYVWVTPHGVPVGLLDPDFTPEEAEQTNYITNYVNTAEAALFSSNFTDPTTGWPAYFDTASAVNFYIVNDLMGNEDGGRFYSSVYLYKDHNNPLLYMGPIWDFDISSGNVNYDAIVDPTIPWVQTQSSWYAQFFSDPSFKASARQQWNALKNNGVLSSWLASISAESATLEQTQRNNFERWPMQGIRVWPNPEANGSYDGEVSYMLDWIRLRMGYMDSFLNNLPATTTTLTVPTGTLRTGVPLTLTAQVTGNNPTGLVTFSYNSIVIGQASLDNTGTATLTTATIAPGTWTIEAFYNGDSSNALSGCFGPTVTILPPLAQTTTNLAASGDVSYGSPQTLTASVIGVSGTTVPTGSVTFTQNGNNVGSASVSASGVATLTTSTLPAGTNSLQAIYGGDLNYAASTSDSVAETEGQGAANVSLSNLNAIYSGSPQPVIVTTQPQGLSYTLTYNGGSSAPTAVGTYAVTATVSDPNYTGSATGTLTIAKAVADVTLGNLNLTYNGGPQTVTVTTQPSGPSYTVTYNGASTAPTGAGTYAVVATVDDPSYTGSATGTLTIAKGSPDVNWPAPAAITYGTPLSSAQLNATSNVAGTFSYSPAQATVLNAGAQTLSTTLTPTDNSDYNQETKSVQIVVNKQSTTTALQASGTSIVPNQTVTLTATVAPTSSGTPTGTISFFDGASLLATEPVANGASTYATTSLLSGSHTLTAKYNGDANYLASQVGAGGVGVQVAPLDFTFNIEGSPSASLAGSKSALLTYSLAPMYGTYPGQVTLAVTGLPSGLQYTISQPTVASNAGPANIVISIAQGNSGVASDLQNRGGGAVLALLLLAPLAGARARKRLRRGLLPVLMVAIAGGVLLSTLAGCTVQPPVTYMFTVTATSGGIQHSAAGSVTVQ